MLKKNINIAAYIVLIAIFISGMGTLYFVNKNGAIGNAIIISGGDNYTTRSRLLLFIVKDKPYFDRTSNIQIKRGDCLEVKYLEDNPDFCWAQDKCDNNIFTGKIILYGCDYPDEVSQEIRVYNDSLLITSLKFEESFACVIEYIPKIRLEYHSEAKMLYSQEYMFKKRNRANVFEMDYKVIEDHVLLSKINSQSISK